MSAAPREVVVTLRSFARTDPAPLLALESAGLTVVRADAAHDRAELARVLPTAFAWIAGTGPVDQAPLEVARDL